MTNPLMTNEGMMKHMADFAASNFAETGELLPMWILVSAEGEIHPVVTPYEGEESKNAVAALIHGLIKKHNIIRVGHMSEVWYLEWIRKWAMSSPAGSRISSPTRKRCTDGNRQSQRYRCSSS